MADSRRFVRRVRRAVRTVAEDLKLRDPEVYTQMELGKWVAVLLVSDTFRRWPRLKRQTHVEQRLRERLDPADFVRVAVLDLYTHREVEELLPDAAGA